MRFGKPYFINDDFYRDKQYPDVGYRLLCLFRYWNMIQYFSPGRSLTYKNWNTILSEFVPQFIMAHNALEYNLTTTKLIVQLQDTHAFVKRPVLDNFKGNYTTPFRAMFVENKLVISRYYFDTLGIKKLVKPGDIILSINGVKVGDLINKYLPYTSASNYSRQLYDMPLDFLLRSNDRQFRLEILSSDSSQIVTVPAIPYFLIELLDDDPEPGKPGYRLQDAQTGYICPARISSSDLSKAKKLFCKTKGIIVDMRCYPSPTFPNSFNSWFKPGYSTFVKVTKASVKVPGSFTIWNPFWATHNGSLIFKRYKGKVVVIVNAETISEAEWDTMALQSSPNVTVIGSTTAGADGDLIKIDLPGDIHTGYSGLGVYYPDGTNAQRKGVKIDIIITPTINGIKAGRDELLEKAMSLIK